MVTKINPVYDIVVPRSFNGKTVSEFTVTFAATVAASTGPGGVLDKVIQTMGLLMTPVMVSELQTTGTVLVFFVEGEFPDDDYLGAGVVAIEAALEDMIQALGTVDSIDISAATVTAGTVYKADQV